MTEETVKISEKGLIKALVIARIAEEKGILPNDYKDILLDGFESLQTYINSDLFWQNDWNQDKCDSLAVMVGIERANLRANEFTKETSEELETDTPEYNYPQRYTGEDDEIIATPPGETIKEQLKQQHMSRKELAKKMCISDKELVMLLEGKALLTTEIANKLEKTLGISAKFWNRLEEIYSEKLVLIKERKNKK